MNATLTIHPEKLYSSEEISDYLSLSLRTVQRLLQTGSLKSYKLHGQYRIKGLDLLNYLDGVRRDPESLALESSRPADLLEALEVQAISVGLALDLVTLVNPAENSDFMPALQALRKHISLELGFILPGVQIHDDADLPARHYQILVHGQQVARGELPQSDADALLKILERMVRQFADEILSRDDVFVMLERLRSSHPVVVDEVLSLDGPQPGKLSIGQLTRVLRGLLTNQVSIRNLARILEILADQLETTSAATELIESVRQGLSRQLCAPLADEQGLIRVVGLSPELESALSEMLTNHQNQPELSRRLFEQLKAQSTETRVLLCSPSHRAYLASLLQRNFSDWHVLSYQEVDRLYRLKMVAELKA